MIDKIKELLKTTKGKFAIYSIFLLVAFFIYISQRDTAEPITTIPIITTPLPTEQIIPSPTTIFVQNKDNIDQTLSVKLNNNKVSSQQINIYKVDQNVVSSESIKKIATLLGFNDENVYKDGSDGDYLWKTDDKKLFGSINQAQIIYEKQTDPASSGPISNGQTAIVSAKKILSDLVGEEFTKSLVSNPKIKYLKTFSSINIYKYGQTTPDQATIFEISFYQTIDQLPVISLSSSTDLITIGIDRQGNIDRLSIFGGFKTLMPNGSTNTLSQASLEKLIPTEGRRITSAASISDEKAINESKNINISVTDIKLGYLQELNILTPVYLVDSVITGDGFPATVATYVVRSTPPN